MVRVYITKENTRYKILRIAMGLQTLNISEYILFNTHEYKSV
jgi:hypothetical protein